MFRDRGIYVFPNKYMMRIFAYDGENAVEYPSLTYAEQLVDFLEINMSPFRKAVNNLKSYDNNTVDFELLMNIFHSIYHLADVFCVDSPVYSFLMTNELRLLDRTASIGTVEAAVSQKNKGLEVLELMTDMQSLLFNYAYIYCSTNGSHTDKVHNIVSGRARILDVRFEEVISTALPSTRIFYMSEFNFPFTKGYRFERLKDYLWFVFINFLQYDVNFSECKYCGHFFIPKTRKKTLYCDRVRTADGRTCKDIGPAEVSRRSAEFSEVLSEYDKAVNRNFKRVERFEDKRTGEKSGKDLDYAEYSEWLTRLREARERWKSGEIGDEDILKVIHELG